MTSEVTQAALKPCPWCGTAEHLSVQWPGSMTADMPDCRCRVVCTHIDHDTVVGPTAYGKFAATTAWNARLTAKSGEGRSGAGVDLGDLEWTEDGYSLRTKYDGDVNGDGQHIVVGGDLIVTFNDSEIADEYRERIIAALNARKSGEGERGQ